MAKASIKGSFKHKMGEINVTLSLIIFEEDGLHFVYCPSMDLTGYGKTESEARESFKIVLAEFIQYTHNKGTIFKELEKLGWKISGGKKKRKVKAPDLQDLLKENEQWAQIFHEKDYKRVQENTLIPEMA